MKLAKVACREGFKEENMKKEVVKKIFETDTACKKCMHSDCLNQYVCELCKIHFY